jgi:hypothetical protein
VTYERARRDACTRSLYSYNYTFFGGILLSPALHSLASRFAKRPLMRIIAARFDNPAAKLEDFEDRGIPDEYE